MESRDDSYREKYEAIDLNPGETVRQVWAAARYADSLKTVGGNIVLTNERLIFEPLKTGPAIGILSKILGHGPTAPIGDEIGELGKWHMFHPWSTPIAELGNVQPENSDRVRVGFQSGESIVFRIAAGRWVPRWQTSRNRQERDDVIQALRATSNPVAG